MVRLILNSSSTAQMKSMAFSEQVSIDHSLKKKTLGILLVTFAILTAGFWFIHLYQTGQHRISEANTLLRSLSVSIPPTLVEGNRQSTEQLLMSLVDFPRVRSAALYTADGSLFAQYLAEVNPGILPAEPGPLGIRIEGSNIEVFKLLAPGESSLSGTLYLSLSIEDDTPIWLFTTYLLLVLLAIFGLGYGTLFSFRTNSATNSRESTTDKKTRTRLKEHSASDSPPQPGLSQKDMKLLEMEERLKLEIMIRKQSEDILKTHHRILEHLAIGNSLEEVLDLVNLNLKRQILPDTLCTIYTMDEERTELTLKSAPQLSDSLQLGLTKWSVSPQGSTFGISAYKNEIVIVENIEDDPQWDQIPKKRDIYEYKSCWSIPIPDPSGNSIGVVGIFCQHSRSPSVEELRHLSSSAFLAGMAITRKRYEEDLQNYSRELVRSNQDLDEFASIASHDLQEPLRKVTAFGERLKKTYGDNLDDRGKDYLDRMLRGTVRMQRFITDLLKYSRAGAKSGPLAPTDLNRLVEDVLIDFEFRMEENGAKVQVEPLPIIEGDKVQLRQVFANLIGNALKFIRKDVVPQITISTSTPKDHHIQIHVEDNGIGFDDSFSARIFRPFERLNSSHAFEGSGMGLALCRKIVERHGGTIRATSAPGRGTRITLEFPTG